MIVAVFEEYFCNWNVVLQKKITLLFDNCTVHSLHQIVQYWINVFSIQHNFPYSILNQEVITTLGIVLKNEAVVNYDNWQEPTTSIWSGKRISLRYFSHDCWSLEQSEPKAAARIAFRKLLVHLKMHKRNNQWTRWLMKRSRFDCTVLDDDV